MDDLFRWFAALPAGTLISARSFRSMWTPYRLADRRFARYGYDWWLGQLIPGITDRGQIPAGRNPLCSSWAHPGV